MTTTLFTARAEAAAGAPLHMAVTARTVASDPAPELDAGGLTVLRREGHLVTPGGRKVADVASEFVPGRLRPSAVRLLATTSVPLGTVLEPFGAEREELAPQDGRTRGLLRIGGEPVAVAWEQATPDGWDDDEPPPGSGDDDDPEAA